MRHPIRSAVAVLGAVALTACGQNAGESGGSDDDGLTVVASTGAWAGVVREIGGDDVEVTAVIDDPVADPHSYESTAEDALLFTEADLAVINGGGYDAFAEGLAEQAPDLEVIDAFALSGHADDADDGDDHADEGDDHADEGDDHADEGDDHAHDHGGANEHVWYDLHVATDVAEEVAAHLGERAPERAEEFEAKAKAFAEEAHELEEELASIGRDAENKRVLATESVGHYLLLDAGLEDVSPSDFVRAVEDDGDIPVAAQAEVTSLVEERKVAAVVHNPQTETDVTSGLVAAAEKAGIPVVRISETPQESGKGYLEWVGGQVRALKEAVAGA